MTLITLIRHGQTDWNNKRLIQGVIDNPLNQTGKEQAKLAAQKISLLPKYDLIISSPLKRAKQTADIIQENLQYQIDIIIMNNFIERHFGELEGDYVCSENYQRIFNEDVVGLESLKDLQQRAVNAIKDIGERYPNKRILVTTHSHFIKGLLSSLLNNFDFTCVLENSSLTNVEFDNGKITLINYNK